MKNVITVSLLFFASFLSAQTSSFVTDRLRAAEYFRIGINSSQKVTGFNTSISGAGSNEKLPTTKAVVDYLTAGFVPIGYYSEGTGIDITGGVITNTAPDQTVTMTDGTGIDVTGTYPNFTFTNTSPNIVQTLSIAGQDLTLSGGGGTVEIPAGSSLGTGFTSGGGSGTIGAATNATITDYFNLKYPSGATGFRLNGVTGDISFVSSDEVSQMGFGNLGFGISSFDKRIEFDETGAFFTDNSEGLKGLEYGEDYSATIITNPRSIPDVGTVDILKQTPVSYTSAAAPNNCIFYSTTLSKLAYKDPGGTVNALY